MIAARMRLESKAAITAHRILVEELACVAVVERMAAEAAAVQVVMLSQPVKLRREVISCWGVGGEKWQWWFSLSTHLWQRPPCVLHLA